MSFLPLLLATVTVATPAPPLPPDPAPGFLKAFAETNQYRFGRPVTPRPTPDGAAVVFLRSSARDGTLSLYEYTVTSGETRELVTPERLLGEAKETLSPAEKARRERQRILNKGFTSFSLSEDGQVVLLPLSGRVYLYDRAGAHAGRVRAVGGADGVIAPRLAPDGNRVAYVRGQDVYVADAASGREARLTRGGSEQLTHGLAEFVAQEEMDRFDGLFWSPDSRRLAYTEVDQKEVQRFTLADPAHPEQPPAVFPYPRAGTPNAKVRLGIIAAGGGPTVWARWDRERYPYLARVIWKEKKAPLTLVVETRDQRELAVLSANLTTGVTKVLHVEKDDAFLELDDLPRWLPDGSGFLFATVRSGQSALELHDADGKLVREVVPRGYVDLFHVDEDGRRAVALTSTGVESTLCEVPLDAAGPAVPLPGEHGDHLAAFARNGALFVDQHSSATSMPDDLIYRRDGKGVTKVGALPSAVETPAFPVRLDLTAVTGSEGRRFDVAVIRPRAFKPGLRYPVVVYVYGGPTVRSVIPDERAYFLQQWIADHGVVVVAIDNRGTPRRPRDWTRATKNKIGTIPLDDQVDALRALGARLPELDLGRVGVYGWSFGGYLAALAVLRRPDVYKVAVAGAPVVDWRDYDTHYTERYLGLPDANKPAYDEASLLTYASKLERPLLLVHGTADDNVYFFNSLKLADALLRAGRPFSFLPLSTTHQLGDATTRENLWSREVDFLLRGL